LELTLFVDEKYKSKILLAKRNRLRRFLTFSLGCLLLSVVGLCLFIYTAAVKIDVSYEGPESDAKITQNTGSGFFLTGSRLVMLSDAATVEIRALGYQDKSVFLDSGQKGQTIKAALTLQRKSLEVVSKIEPIQAAWHIDGVYYSSGSVLQAQLKPGKYRLTLMSDNLVPHEQDIVVPFGAGQPQKIEIAPESALANYVIDTLPTGAKIYLNDKYLGETPITGEAPVGNYSLSVQMAGYQTIEDVIKSKDFGEGLTRSYILPLGSRTVKTHLKPSGGELYLDGKLISPLASITVKALGTSQLTYAKEGYASKTFTIDSSTSNLTIDLDPTYAFLTVRSEPGAQVEINGVATGPTPLKLRLQTGEYTVTLKKAGYRAVTRQAHLSSNGDALVDGRLILLSDYYVTNSTPVHTHPAGIELFRVMPKRFSMGAPRSEIGQRANELRRDIDFSRMIYVSRYEITEQQFSRFLGSPSSSRKPKTVVSWHDAAKFCNWLSKQEGLPLFYKEKAGRIIGFDSASRGYRLPSEAEWEFIAKYHKKSRPSIFTWGDEYKVKSSAGNIADKSAEGSVKKFIGDYNDQSQTIADVGSYQPEESGFYDFSGNASEWVHDTYSLAPPENRVYMNYLGDPYGEQHVIKGSNYLSASWQELRASFRETAVGGREDVGFRVARYIH
jgi:formylglycine-generating enzyme required for sulfatase activity